MYISNVISSLLFNTVPGPEDSEYSCAAWKRVPTTLEVIFALALPYRPPESPVGAFLWRKRVWFESTFALTMLQPWEKVLISEWLLVLWFCVGFVGFWLRGCVVLQWLRGCWRKYVTRIVLLRVTSPRARKTRPIQPRPHVPSTSLFSHLSYLFERLHLCDLR